MSKSEDCCNNNCGSCECSEEEVVEGSKDQELSEKEEFVNSYPGIDKKFYVEFRFKVNGKNSHYHDGYSDWLLYPSGLDVRHFKTAFEEENVIFVDSMDELKDLVTEDTKGNCFFFGECDDFVISVQDTDAIRLAVYEPYAKIAVRHLDEIQLRLHENEMKGRILNKPKTLVEMYEKLTGMSATEKEDDGN